MSKIESIHHSLSHIMAQAVLEFFPKTKLGFGPAIENGFYYDFQFTKPLEEKDSLGWNGQSGKTENELINQPEVKLEDVKTEATISPPKPEIIEQKIPLNEKTENKFNIEEVEKKLINDPDSSQNGNKRHQ